MMLLFYVIAGLLSAFFIFASSIKLLGWQKMIFQTQLNYMHKYGLNRQILAGIGCIELFGAVAIWFFGSKLGMLGVLALFFDLGRRSWFSPKI